MIHKFILVLCLFLGSATAQEPEAPRRLLFVGNSYTYFNDLPQMVRSLAKSAGRELEVESLTQGGASLAQHLERGELAQWLAEGNFDWVIIQEQSMLGTELLPGGELDPNADTSGFRKAASELIRLARKHTVEPVLMLTWARREHPGMQAVLDAAIVGLAQEERVRWIPAGTIWQRVRALRPGIKLYENDGSHPAPGGSYVVACSVLHHLLGLELKGLPGRVEFTPAGSSAPQRLVDLEPADADFLRTQVQACVLQTPLTEALPAPEPEQQEQEQEQESAQAFELQDLEGMARVLQESYSEKELKQMVAGLKRNLSSHARLRALPLANAVQPALHFLPSGLQHSPAEVVRLGPGAGPQGATSARPEDLEELAYASLPELQAQLRSGQVSCLELTEMYLARLARLDEQLECVINFTEERAIAQARLLDKELAAGLARGPLHGIPWVAKDLLAVRGTPTTWGAKPFEHQMLDEDATVVERLDAAGAILIAKVSLGALAMGDVWFGGTTKNPWNLSQGSSGSSAGPSSATAAGCAGFSIGSETLGSIVSPSARCGNSSLRPSFGRVPRGGAMTLSWSMDKLGPICRSAEDAALVFDAIHGAHPDDPSSVSLAFDALLPAEDVSGWQVGYLKRGFERSPESQSVLEELEALGVELIPIELPSYPLGSMSFVLSAEAGAAFDEFSRSLRDEELVAQESWNWPTTFRAARLISAVDYLRANRLRSLNIQDFNQAIAGLDALVHPSFAGQMLLNTNLTGHPTFIAPAGFRPDGTPHSISFTGQLYGETRLMTLARAWQASTDYHLQHPDL